jgi:hypothetical protein
MHHSLRLYSRNREWVAKFYIFWGKRAKLPVIGRLIRWVANAYGNNLERAYMLTTSEAEEIVEIAEGLALGPCTCRTLFKNCDNLINAEIMLRLNGNVFIEDRPEDYREVTTEEAREILRQCHERGLVHTIIKCREDYYAICNCCPCCCIPLRLSKQYGIGALKRNEDIVGQFKEYQIAHRG